MNISRKSITIALAGAGILSIILAFIVSSAFPLAGYGSVKPNAPSDDGSGYFTISQCEEFSVTAAASIVDVDGFVTVQPRTFATPEIVPGTPTPGLAVGIYEFVLRPGSTGHIAMTYDFCPPQGQVADEKPLGFNIVNSTELRHIFDQTNSTNREMYVLDADAEENADLLTYVPPGSSTGIKIYAEEIAKLSEHALKVNYAVTASSTIQEGTFITANFYRVCPGEILTVGDDVNEESSKWASGPFYGCSG
jgi:hypothetical protein